MTGKALSAVVALVLTVVLSAGQADQQVFQSPEQAVAALLDAVKARDLNAVVAIFGADGRDLAASSDPATGERNREVFAAAMAEGWSLAERGAEARELLVGNEAWPFPVPIVRRQDGWRFDTAAGREELIARRIGRNELAAIRVCRTYVSAQRIYAARGHDGQPPGAYARRFLSEPGTENGLYWPANSGRKRSPMGDLVAKAADDHASRVASRDAPVPFHGYRFRILEGQGAAAPGGPVEYVVDGRLFRGFALVAWPAEYDVTGVMTFIVNSDGVVHERDLGPETSASVAAVDRYDPDPTWRRVGDGSDR